MRPADEAVVVPVGERELAAWRVRRGERVVEERGRYWRMSRPGFWEPVHWLAELSASEARRPAAGLGFRAVLRSSDADAANGAMPVHVLEELAGWGPRALVESRQHRLRQAAKTALSGSARLSSAVLKGDVELVEITGRDLLARQGYEVLVSSLERTKAGKAPEPGAYVESLVRDGLGGPAVFLAGIQDGLLIAYMSGWAAGSTAYSQRMHIHSDALATQVGTALAFAFVEACRRGEGIRRVVNGLHSVEDEGLTGYKESIGFPMRRFPAVVRFLPGVEPLLRALRPHAAYRLTGRS